MAKSTKKKVTFESCDKAFVENNFGLSQIDKIPELQDWIESVKPLSSSEKKLISDLLENISFRLTSLNGQSLKINFIAPLLSFVGFNSEKYTAFADEKLESEVGESFLTGRLDWFVAKGFYKPEIPIFFLQQFVWKKGESNDPDGQILAKMIASRTLHYSENEVIYGVIVLGRSWTFIVLKGNEYAFSNSYDCMKLENLIKIFEILKASKKIIEQKIEVLEARANLNKR